jgi:hypothetical protein
MVFLDTSHSELISTFAENKKRQMQPMCQEIAALAVAQKTEILRSIQQDLKDLRQEIQTHKCSRVDESDQQKQTLREPELRKKI